MSEQFIKLQLFGDPAGDPAATSGKDPAGSPTPTPGAEGGDTASNAAEELYNFQANFVPKAKYDEAVKRGDDFLDAIIKHKEAEVLKNEGVVKQEVNVQNLARNTFIEDNHMTDIEYCKNVLAIRNAQIAAGAPDPFLPADPEDKDYQIAENVADVMDQCIKEAKGDNASFIALFNARLLKDAPLPKNFLRR